MPQNTLSPQAVFLFQQFAFNLFHISKARYSVIIRTNAAGLLSFCLLYCVCGLLHILTTINQIPCRILSDSPGRVTSALACHTSYEFIPQDPRSLQHFTLFLLPWLTPTCEYGNTSKRKDQKNPDNFGIYSQLFLQ